MRTKWTMGLLALSVLLATALTATVIRNSQGPKKGPEYDISVIIRSPQNAYWDAVKLGMDQAALDMNAEINYVTLLEENDSPEQAAALELEIQSGAQAVVLAPVLGPEISEAIRRSSVPLVALEVDSADNTVNACVSAGNAVIGKEIGQQIRADFPELTKLIWVTLEKEAALTKERYHGLLEGLDDIVMEKVVIPNDNLRAKQILKERMAQEEWTHIVALEASALLTVAQVINDLPYQERWVYGADSTPEIAYHLMKGVITKIAAVNNYNIGYLSVKTAAEILRKETAESFVQVDFSLIDAGNMFTAPHQRLLFPFVK